MAEFPTDKVLLVGADEAAWRTNALTIGQLEIILHKQEALEYIQKAIEACTKPAAKPTLAAIDAAIAAELVP